MFDWLTTALWGVDTSPTDSGPLPGEEPLDEESFLRDDAANGSRSLWHSVPVMADEEPTSPQRNVTLKHRLSIPRKPRRTGSLLSPTH